MSGIDTITRLTPLLAQRSNWTRMGDRFSGEHLQWQREDTLGFVLLGAVLVLGFWVLRRLSKWQLESPKRHCPKRLLKELAAAHGIGRRDRQVCREVAAELGYEEPAELFVRPEARAELEKRDRRLAARLFGASSA